MNTAGTEAPFLSRIMTIKPDSVDADTLNHLDWYEATGFQKPYPGEATVR